MSDDLISRKFLLECAEYDDKWRLVIPYEKVKNAPTAFNKEKVINDLLSASICTSPDEDSFVELEEAIEIVEKGRERRV